MIEDKNHIEAIESWMEERKQIAKALKPFSELIKNSSGRIPVEKLSFNDWHKLVDAYEQILNETKL